MQKTLDMVITVAVLAIGAVVIAIGFCILQGRLGIDDGEE